MAAPGLGSSVPWRWAFVPVFAFMAWQLFDVIDQNAVDVLFSDQWFYLRPILLDASWLELFRHQHSAHRMGLGLVLTQALMGAAHLDMRVEAYIVGVSLCLAAMLGLWFKVWMTRRGLEWSDLLIPILFLTPRQWEIVTGTPNTTHSGMPLLLLLALGLTWTMRKGKFVRHALIFTLHVCLLYTGYGLFAAAGVFLFLGLEVLHGRRTAPAQALSAAITLALCVAAVVTYFVDYDPTLGRREVLLTDPQWTDYITLITTAVSGYFGIEGWAAIPIGGTTLLLSGYLLCRHVLRIARNDGEAAHDSCDLASSYAISLLLLFSLFWAVTMTAGRIDLGTTAGTASRLLPFFAPLFLGLYMHAVCMKHPLRLIPIATLVVAVSHGHTLSHADANVAAGGIRQIKVTWRDAYLATGSVERADAVTGHSVHPLEVHPDLEPVLIALEDRQLSFLRFHTVSRPRDERLYGEWGLDSAPPQAGARCRLARDGRFRIGSRRGFWKTGNGQLFVWEHGNLNWMLLGSYRVHDDSLVLRRPSPQTDLIWKRR
jgi:hypothetical protein